MRPVLNVFTLALDAMPWIACIFAELNRLTDIEWRWVVVEGVALPVKDTKWCKAIEPRLSRDGTTDFLDALAHHPRISVLRKPLWQGKTEMVNAALDRFEHAGVLLQVDGDEVWSADQLRRILELFEDDLALGSAAFACRYFVGPNLRTTDNVDWHRAWRFVPGDRAVTHEPPKMAVARGRHEGWKWTARLGLIFDHYSYALPQQVAFKECYYGYAGALSGWRRLQTHDRLPTVIRPFFAWSAPETQVDRVFPCTS